MRHVYIAGPFRASTPWKIEQNVIKAEEWALLVAQAGHVAVCPHTMYRHYHGTCTEAYWLEATMSLLQRCDAAVFIEGWEGSEGSREENKAARRLKIPIWEHGESKPLEQWVKEL